MEWRRDRFYLLCLHPREQTASNLSSVSRILRILHFHSHDLRLKPSFTFYNRHGKVPTQRLRFSKTGDPNLEKAYATHLVLQGSRPNLINHRQLADE